MKVKYKGNRKRDITLEGAVTGKLYYLAIADGEMTIDQRDAPAFLESGDWQTIEAETEAPRDLRSKRSTEGTE